MKTHTLTICIQAPEIDDPRGTMIMSLDGEMIAYQEFVDMLHEEDLVADPAFCELIRQFVENALL